MASPTRWTWVWVDSRSRWWTGRPGVLQSWGHKGWWQHPSGGTHNLWMSGWLHSQGNSPVRCPQLVPPRNEHLCQASPGTESPSPGHLDEQCPWFETELFTSMYLISISSKLDSKFPSWTWMSGVFGFSTKFWPGVHAQREERDPLNVSKLNCTWFFKLPKVQLCLVPPPDFQSASRINHFWWFLNFDTSESKTSH